MKYDRKSKKTENSKKIFKYIQNLKNLIKSYDKNDLWFVPKIKISEKIENTEIKLNQNNNEEFVTDSNLKAVDSFDEPRSMFMDTSSIISDIKEKKSSYLNINELTPKSKARELKILNRNMSEQNIINSKKKKEHRTSIFQNNFNPNLNPKIKKELKETPTVFNSVQDYNSPKKESKDNNTDSNKNNFIQNINKRESIEIKYDYENSVKSESESERSFSKNDMEKENECNTNNLTIFSSINFDDSNKFEKLEDYL